jgi:hypothetical protein
MTDHEGALDIISYCLLLNGFQMPLNKIVKKKKGSSLLESQDVFTD